jgi:hypothetical protein
MKCEFYAVIKDFRSTGDLLHYLVDDYFSAFGTNLCIKRLTAIPHACRMRHSWGRLYKTRNYTFCS